MPHPFEHQPPSDRLLAQRAHGLRRAPTVSEQKLWTALSGEKLGVAFRRQVVLGHRFIVDFLAPSLKLVVEVDGGCHRERVQADARRDQKLRRLGYRVVRIPVEVVTHDLERAVEVVRRAVSRGPTRA